MTPLPTGEEVAQAWREASPAAVHPELDNKGQAIIEASALNTLTDLLEGFSRHHPHTNRPAPFTILDYAAGPGRLSKHLAKHFGEVILVDTNPTFLALAAKDGPSNYRLLEVDAVPKVLPIVDVIVCVNLFLHLPAFTAGRLLALFAKSLEPDGLLALHIPIYDIGTTPATWTAVGTWTPPMLEASAGAAGLEVLEVSTNAGEYRGQPGPFHARLHYLRPMA